MKMTLTPSSIAAIRTIAYIARCAIAAMLSYAAANALGLGHPVWAVASSLIVSQETARETRNSFLWRVAGTLIGAGIAFLTALLVMPDPTRPLIATGVAVAACAAVVRHWPRLRVCLWTAPLVLLTVTSDQSIIDTTLQRSGEVLLGGTIGAAIHLFLDRIVVRHPEGNEKC